MWYLIDNLIWAAVGAAAYAMYWRGTHSCVVCLEHTFSLNKALGLTLF